MKKRNIPTDTTTYNATISACENGDGECKVALELLQEMKTSSIPADKDSYKQYCHFCM